MKADDTNPSHQVVINQERQYSVWPADSVAPEGWHPVGFINSLDECLAYIDRIWTDLRPQSVRAPHLGQRCGTEKG